MIAVYLPLYSELHLLLSYRHAASAWSGSPSTSQRSGSHQGPTVAITLSGHTKRGFLLSNAPDFHQTIYSVRPACLTTAFTLEYRLPVGFLKG